MEGAPGYPDGEGRHERVQVKSSRRESEAPGEEGEEVQSEGHTGGIRRNTGLRKRSKGPGSGGS